MVHKRKQWATCLQIHHSLSAVFLRQQFNGKLKFSHLLSLISFQTFFFLFKKHYYLLFNEKLPLHLSPQIKHGARFDFKDI